MNQQLAGVPGEVAEFEARSEGRWRRIVVSNDTPNLVYVRFSKGATTAANDLTVKPRRGIEWSTNGADFVSVLVQPDSDGGTAPDAGDRVAIFLSAQDGVSSSEWGIGLTANGTPLQPVAEYDSAGNPLGSTLDGGAARLAQLVAGTAQIGSTPAIGADGTLANDVASGAGVDVTGLALFRTATVFVSVSAGTTITVNLLGKSGAWYKYTTWTPTGADSNAIAITGPATGIQVLSGTGVTWTVEYQTAQ